MTSWPRRISNCEVYCLYCFYSLVSYSIIAYTKSTLIWFCLQSLQYSDDMTNDRRFHTIRFHTLSYFGLIFRDFFRAIACVFNVLGVFWAILIMPPRHGNRQSHDTKGDVETKFLLKHNGAMRIRTILGAKRYETPPAGPNHIEVSSRINIAATLTNYLSWCLWKTAFAHRTNTWSSRRR